MTPLEELPLTILQLIYDYAALAAPNNRCITLPLTSTSLALATKSCLYKSIRLTSNASLKLLCRTVDESIEIAKSIESLVIDFVAEENEITPIEAEESYDSLYAFFTHLSAMQHLAIKSSSYIASLILSREFAEETCEKLVDLEFENCFETLTRGKHIQPTSRQSDNADYISLRMTGDDDGNGGKTLREWFYYIELYPNLLRLGLVITSLSSNDSKPQIDSPASKSDEDDFEFDLIDTLHILTLTGPVQHPQVISLIACFSQLQFLSLTDNSNATTFAPILEATHPGVRHLCLSTSSTSTVTPSPVDVSLLRFTRLDSSSLIGPVYSSALFDFLDIPLVELLLGAIDAERLVVTELSLKELMKGEKKLTSLRHLTLEGNIDSLTGECEYVSAIGIEKLMAVAEKQGILLDGSLVEAVFERRREMIQPLVMDLQGKLHSLTMA